MTKEAVRKREYRANRESKEQADKRRAKDNEATKKKNDMKTAAEIKAMNEANKLRMRIARETEVVANSSNSSNMTPLEVEVPSDSSNVNAAKTNPDEPSEYEKIRLSNIQERNQKFKEIFGFTHPSASKKEGKKSEMTQLQNSTISLPRRNENLVDNSEIQSSHVKISTATSKAKIESNVHEFRYSNASYAEKLADLVKEGHLFANTAHLEYLYGSNLMEETSFHKPGGRQTLKKKRRHANLDRKSKKAKKSQAYRDNETQDQYHKRLEQSAKYNRNLSENVLYREKRKHVKKLKR